MTGIEIAVLNEPVAVVARELLPLTNLTEAEMLAQVAAAFVKVQSAGWKLTRREPTGAMARARAAAISGLEWQAMWDAAPSIGEPLQET